MTIEHFLFQTILNRNLPDKCLPTRTLLYSNSRRVAAEGEKPHLSVWWVLKILWRSQDICLFSESRKVL